MEIQSAKLLRTYGIVCIFLIVTISAGSLVDVIAPSG